MLEKESNIIRREAENNKIKLQIETEAETEALKSRVRGNCCVHLWHKSLTIYLAPYLCRGSVHWVLAAEAEATRIRAESEKEARELLGQVRSTETELPLTGQTGREILCREFVVYSSRSSGQYLSCSREAE